MAERDDDGERLELGSQPTIVSGGDKRVLASADTIAGDSTGRKRKGDHFAHRWRLDAAWHWTVVVERSVSSRSLVVVQ